MSFFLDGVEIPSPKEFSREYIPVISDTNAVNGKMGRDVRILEKERFTLSWEVLSKAEIDSLLTTLAKNTAVAFYCDEDNLNIPSTNVFINLNSIGYETVGSDYIGSLTLELTEEQ